MADLARFSGVVMLGVDEQVWRYISTKPVEGSTRPILGWRAVGAAGLGGCCRSHLRPSMSEPSRG